MMPGPHMPSRRQDYPYHPHLPPQTHSPAPNPYAHYPPPPYHGHPHPHAPHYPPQWYQPYPQHYPPQPPPPRPFIPHQPQLPPQGPIIVSSNPHAHPVPQVPRPRDKTPPVAPVRSYPPPPPSMPQEQPPPAPTPQQQAAPVESPATPATPATTISTTAPLPPAASQRRPSSITEPAHPRPARYMPWYPPLPWYSNPDETFPPPSRTRRRRRGSQRSSVPLELPDLSRLGDGPSEVEQGDQVPDAATVVPETAQEGGEQAEAQSTAAAPSDLETPITSEAPSEADSTHPTTPSSLVAQQTTPRQASHTRTATKPAVPLIPIKPVVPNIAPGPRKSSLTSPPLGTDKDAAAVAAAQPPSDAAHSGDTTKPSSVAEAAPLSPQRVPPKSWAELLRSNKPAAPPTAATSSFQNESASAKASTLAEVIRAYSVDQVSKFAFIEPRGLVNTGNMCYMNSILQILVFCAPFYDFLDQVGKRAAHSFKSDTPLLDAMIMFMREFKVIDSATSVEQLRMRLKDNELEQYGDAFIPEYVYDVIRRLPRFSTMRRGQQQDAEEFLGFLLEGLHDECVQVLRSVPSNASDFSEVTSPTSERSSITESGWMEVGPKQRAAVTRSSGHVVSDSAITKIFGGNLRSEFRVPGLKNSVTLEPYQPLQLDIGAPHVNNITDALKGLTRSETIQGEFNSPRGPGISATKQVFIETLPRVLILHLKRFQYDNTGGAQKIWKRIGYPLELEIPKEVFTPSKRSKLSLGGALPKYRLTAVVYHHGKSASGGHYTVDVRRQEGREWIRLDDTVIRRVRSEDVAAGGAEEDPKILAAALENHKRDVQSGNSGNIFDRFADDEEEKEDGKGWSQVNGLQSGTSTTTKKWSGVVNGTETSGTATPSTKGQRTPKGREYKGDSVAYILIYQQIK